jgi:hypothetical protein
MGAPARFPVRLFLQRVRRGPCAALLFVSLLSAPLFAEEGDKPIPPLKALVSVDQDDIKENSGFLLNILVNYDEPLDVSVTPPDFEDNFTLERLRSEPHIMSGSQDDADKWTEIELLITPKATGTFILGPFAVSTPHETISTPPMEIAVYPKEKDAPPKLVWGGVKSIPQGKTGIAYLSVLNEGGASGAYPGDVPVSVAAPKNAIIQRLELTGDDKYAGVVFRIHVIPLEGGEVRLEPTRFYYEGRDYAVPPLTIRVVRQGGAPEPSVKKPVPSPFAFAAQTGRQPKSAPDAPPFPQCEAGFFARLSGRAFTDALDRAKRLWEQAEYAAALALLRSGERGSIAGGDFAELRRACERALGVAVMANETPRPTLLFVVPAALALLFIVVKLIAFALAARARRGKRHFPVKAAVAAALIAVVCAAFLVSFKLDEGKSAVMKNSPSFLVPENGQTAAGFFEEGAPVRVGAKSAAWTHVESEKGSSAWVPSENMALY